MGVVSRANSIICRLISRASASRISSTSWLLIVRQCWYFILGSLRQRLGLLCVLGSALTLSLSLVAQAQTVSDSGRTKLAGLVDRVSIDVKSFNIVGENPISESKSYAIVNRYLGADRGINDIEDAAEALENELRELGESFYRVSFPPQEISDGTVELRVTRYTVGNINVTGNAYYSAENITRSLPQLVQGQSPSSRAMARSLTVANQNSGKRTRLTLTTGTNEDEIDATLTVVDQDPKVFSVWLNNTGTPVSGDFRVGTSVSHRNMFGRDHTGTATFISSPEDFNDVQQFALSYKVPLYRLGANVNMFAVKSEVDTGTVAEFFEVAGSGDVYGVGYSQVLSKVDNYRHQYSLQLADKLFDNDIRFLSEQIATDVRSRPLSIAYQGSWNNGKGLELRGALTWVENLSGGGDNNQLAYDLTRIGANQDWNKYSIDANLQYASGNWLYTGGLSYTDTSDRLITGEQFALGGMNSVRGLEERELTGDQGVRLNLAIWAPSIAKTLRPIAFIDYGRVTNNQPIEGEFSSESVLSTGLMLNWNPSDRISASASYGYLIDGIDFVSDATTSASRDGDGKLHFNLSYRF